MKSYITAIYCLTKEKETENKENSTDKQPIIRIKDIASKIGVAPPSVVDYIQRLKTTGIINVFPRKGVSLTKNGMREALIISNRFRIVECFFSNVLKIDQKIATEQAHKIEHLMDPVIIKSLYDYIESILGCPNVNCNLSDLCLPQ